MTIMIVIYLVAAAITTWTVGLSILRGWSPSFLRAQRRGQLISAAVDPIVLLALVRVVAPPPGPWVWFWLLAAAAVGLGLAGVIRRWPRLGWTPQADQTQQRTRTRKVRPARIGAPWRILFSCCYLAAGAAVVVIAA